MIKRYRDLLRVVITDLRHTLSGDPNSQRGDLDRELERLGLAPDGTLTPFDALPNPTPAERQARRVAEAMMNAAEPPRSLTRTAIVERAVYTWINRLLALRAMEARGLITEVLRADTAYDGLSEALFVLRQTQPARAAGPDGGWWAAIEDACQAQAAALPGLFDLADPAAALRPSTPALLRCVTTLGTPPAGYTTAEADAAFADPDAIGWAYQFYQEEAKARTYAKLNSGGKAGTRAEIAAVTQLFTEPYMVKWLLQNSLGRTYRELYPDSRLPETWEYYVRISESEESANERISESADQRGFAHPSIRSFAHSPTRPFADSPIRSLADLTFMDPCMGSGHFEREAFDMFAAMYREQHPDLRAAAIADRILTHHLHGIDLDPRAAQLAALTLYLRAWELVRDERRVQRLPGPGSYHPPAMNLATTPTGLTPGSLERHLQRHPEDRIYRPLLEGIFAALEQADVLGSLLRPGEQLDAAIRAFRTQGSRQLGLLPEDAGLNHLLDELARHDPAELKRVLLGRVARSFAAEAADADDVAMALFGREAGEGLRFLQLLDRQYAVVTTNPPYMGSKNMSAAVKAFVEMHYFEGRRDLYTAFILSSFRLCGSGGRFAMIAQQSWAFLSSFAPLRASADDNDKESSNTFNGILIETRIEALAHLGRYAFSEIGNAAVAPLMFVSFKVPVVTSHRIWACRLSARRPSEEQAALLLAASQSGYEHELVHNPAQHSLVSIPGSPLVYWVGDETLSIIVGNMRLSAVADVVEGLGTRWDARFLRLNAEIPRNGAVSNRTRWLPFVKGGGYCRWTGRQWFYLDWELDGARILDFKDDSGKRRSVPRNRHYYFNGGLTYSAVAQGSLAVRKLEGDTIAGDAGPMIIPHAREKYLAGVLNSRYVSYVLRMISPTLQLKTGYVALSPLPQQIDQAQIIELVESCTSLKASLISNEQTERLFDPLTQNAISSDQVQERLLRLSAVLSCLEGILEERILEEYGLTTPTVGLVLSETGVPAGFHPLIQSYDHLPPMPEDALPPVSRARDALVRHMHSTLTLPELNGIKAALRSLYESGPGTAEPESESFESLPVVTEEDENGPSGAYIPIPPETFLEELSQKLQIHPISVYWLLEELRAEGVRCKPEELRLLEDRLSVLVLRLLGHRWPRQLAAGEPVPAWSDPDGIIPLTALAGETSLAERVRDRLRAEDGDRGAQQVEALLLELTGLTLEEWLRRTFFARHVRQFKHRPIAWHLASTPIREGGRKTKTRRTPAFECLLYYHACRGDVLARLRAHYVAPLIRLETATAAEARRRGDETAAASATARIHELEEFTARLRTVEELAFAGAELDHLLASEPLDRWSGDGIVPPASADDLIAQERAWRVDINDGVRVNVAPLQLAGLLTGDVLRPDDARKAIADRARWRADERRWVREGVLPRCGWMDEDVPESPRWTARAPEREAEQRKLEEKRKAVRERLGTT